MTACVAPDRHSVSLAQASSVTMTADGVVATFTDPSGLVGALMANRKVRLRPGRLSRVRVPLQSCSCAALLAKLSQGCEYVGALSSPLYVVC